MGSVDVLRNKAEEYLEKARAISDRQRARLLLVQAHNYLKLDTPPLSDGAARASERYRRPGVASRLEVSRPCSILVGVSDIARA
jgi:hypothetical protein